MARTPKVLYQGQLPATKTTLYTVPALTTTYITAMVGYNTDADNQTVIIYYNPGGTSRINFQAILAQNERLEYQGAGDVLEAADLIEGQSTEASAVDFVIFGIEET